MEGEGGRRRVWPVNQMFFLYIVVHNNFWMKHNKSSMVKVTLYIKINFQRSLMRLFIGLITSNLIVRHQQFHLIVKLYKMNY